MDAKDALDRGMTEVARAGLSGATTGIRAASRLVRWLQDGDVSSLQDGPDGDAFEVERPGDATIRGWVAGPADGVTVVLTHGYGLTKASWNLVAAELVERGDRVIAFDWRAHGESDIGNIEVTTAVLVDDLHAVLEALEVEEALLVAHSTGGYVSLAALVDRPEVADRLQGLVLVSTLAGELLEDPRDDGLHLLRNSVLDRLVRNESLRLLIAGFAQGTAVSSAVSRELLDEFTDADHGALVSLIEDLAGKSYYGELAGIELPAVVVCGSDDLTTPPSHGEAIAEELQHARVVTVDEASHLLNWQHPERIIELVAELLDAQGADTAEGPGAHPGAAAPSEEIESTGPGHALFILNPVAGQHDPDETQATVSEALSAGGFDVEVKRTEEEGDAARWAADAAEQGADLIVVAGGDGTVREALEGVADSDGDAPVAAIPMGTANLPARALEIPVDDVAAAAELAASGVQRRIDLLEVVGDQRHAMLMVDAGFDAELVRDSTRSLKDALGAFAYVVAGLKNTVGLRTVDVVLELDGELHPTSGHSVLCLNIGRIGQTFVVDEDIQPDDGLLHVGVASSPNPLGVAVAAAGMAVAGKDAQPNIEWHTCQHLRLVVDPPLPLQIDGDAAGETPLELRVVPSAVAVVVPKARG